MPSLLKRLSRRTLSRRVLVSMLLLAFVPTLVLAGLVYWTAEASLRVNTRSTLYVAAQNKKNALDRYIAERLKNAAALRSAPGVITGYQDLKKALETNPIDSEPYRRAAEPHARVFRYYAEVYNFVNYHLFSPEGELVYSYKAWPAAAQGLSKGTLAASELHADVRKVVENPRDPTPRLSDFRVYPDLPQPAAFVVGPVLSDDALLCVVVMQINTAELDALLSDATGLGDTGETLAATKIDGKLWLFAASRDASATFDPATTNDPQTFLALRAAVDGATDKPFDPREKDDSDYRYETDYHGKRVVQSWAFVPGLDWGIVVKQDVDEAYELLTVIGLAVAGLLTVLTVIVFGLALWLAESIAKPIRAAAHAAARVADGDLTTEVQPSGDEETAQLLRAIQAMTEQLGSLIRRIQESSVSLLSTATQIAATARQQERTVQDFGASTAESVAAVREISATNHELVHTMGDVAQVAQHTADTAAQGREKLATMEAAVEKLAAETSAVSQRLSVISERANTISMVVTTITKVADQTNLLSINAAIEAEKAGEAGLGFLVVAREIRRLADQTAVATLDIERVVKDMQGSVAAGVMEMDKFTEQVRQGVFEMRGLSGQLGNIIQEIQGVTAQFGRVNEGMRAQAVGAEQIREAMARLSEGAQQTAQSIVEFNRATSHMREAVGSLKDEVSRFTTKDAGGRTRG